MTKPIRKVAVLGSGVMGGGIAAHLANAGIPVLLLDIVPPKLTEAERAARDKRDSIAAGALDKLKKSKPAAFMAARNAGLIRIGNFDDDLAQARRRSVVEAIIDRLTSSRRCSPSSTLSCGDTNNASNPVLRIADMLRAGASLKQRFSAPFVNPRATCSCSSSSRGRHSTMSRRGSRLGARTDGKGS